MEKINNKYDNEIKFPEINSNFDKIVCTFEDTTETTEFYNAKDMLENFEQFVCEEDYKSISFPLSVVCRSTKIIILTNYFLNNCKDKYLNLRLSKGNYNIFNFLNNIVTNIHFENKMHKLKNYLPSSTKYLKIGHCEGRFFNSIICNLPNSLYYLNSKTFGNIIVPRKLVHLECSSGHFIRGNNNNLKNLYISMDSLYLNFSCYGKKYAKKIIRNLNILSITVVFIDELEACDFNYKTLIIKNCQIFNRNKQYKVCENAVNIFLDVKLKCNLILPKNINCLYIN